MLYIFILTESWAPDTDKNHRSIFFCKIPERLLTGAISICRQFSCAKHILYRAVTWCATKVLYIFILTESWAPDTDKNHRSIFFCKIPERLLTGAISICRQFSCAKHILYRAVTWCATKVLYIFILTESWAPDTDKNHRSIFLSVKSPKEFSLEQYQYVEGF